MCTFHVLLSLSKFLCIWAADLFQDPSGQTSYTLQKHLIVFFQKWLRHVRAKISLFDNGAWGLSIQGGILLRCVQCWPPDMYTAQHKSSSCASENVTQSTQCSQNLVVWRAGPGSLTANLQRADRPGRACQRERANGQELLPPWLYKAKHWALRLSLNYEKLGVMLILHMREDGAFSLGPR